MNGLMILIPQELLFLHRSTHAFLIFSPRFPTLAAPLLAEGPVATKL